LLLRRSEVTARSTPRHGDSAQALMLLRQADEIATELGMTPLRHAISELQKSLSSPDAERRSN